MSIALIVTKGFSNGSLVGTIADVVTSGYTIGEVVDVGNPIDSESLDTATIDSVAIDSEPL